MTEDGYKWCHFELLIGCGHARDKRMWWPLDLPAENRVWTNLVTLDHNAHCDPDFLSNLSINVVGQRFRVFARHYTSGLSWSEKESFDDNTFNEIHAYEVLEHLGAQGQYHAFFAQFSELWRILKPGGLLFATVPSRFSPWLWGDPSHTRAILPETLVFLDQSEYIRQCDGPVPTSMSDFRHIYHADFERLYSYDDKSHTKFILRAVKPSRLPEKFDVFRESKLDE